MRNTFRYFFHQPERPAVLPKQYTYDYNIQEATADELRLMKLRYARTPLEAKLLLKGMTAMEYISAHPRPTRWQRISRYAYRQFVALVMYIEGSMDERPVVKPPKHDHSKLPVRYVFDRRGRG